MLLNNIYYIAYPKGIIYKLEMQVYVHLMKSDDYYLIINQGKPGAENRSLDEYLASRYIRVKSIIVFLKDI